MLASPESSGKKRISHHFVVDAWSESPGSPLETGEGFLLFQLESSSGKIAVNVNFILHLKNMFSPRINSERLFLEDPCPF